MPEVDGSISVSCYGGETSTVEIEKRVEGLEEHGGSKGKRGI